MSKFRIGDMVTVTDNSSCHFEIGTICTIIKKSVLSNTEETAWLIEDKSSRNTQHLYERQFQPYIADKLDLI